jgi:hypothetical protein
MLRQHPSLTRHRMCLPLIVEIYRRGREVSALVLTHAEGALVHSNVGEDVL